MLSDDEPTIFSEANETPPAHALHYEVGGRACRVIRVDLTRVRSQVSTKATGNVQQLMQQDADDESLARYKASLLGNSAPISSVGPADCNSAAGDAAAGFVGDEQDPRRVIPVEFRVLFEDDGEADVVYAIDTAEGLAKMASCPFIMKEHANYKVSFISGFCDTSHATSILVRFQFHVEFRVQHEIVTGLKFVQKVNCSGVR